jgi:hypothetical protein
MKIAIHTYLSDLLWVWILKCFVPNNSANSFEYIDRFTCIYSKHHIKCIFQLFDRTRQGVEHGHKVFAVNQLTHHIF